MALGAERGLVFRTVLGMAFRLMGLGVIAGGVASIATNLVISSQMWTVAAFDPIALLSGVIVIIVLGLAACYVPALRATRVNPIVALRHE
jgi:putative ABC transport system permease protein